jgi:hypothetical protein
MARADVALGERAAPPAPSDPSRTGESTESARVPKAYELTDRHGHRAYAWRVDRKWVVESDHQALRRRILRALKKPLWVREDVLGEDGGYWSTLVHLQPDDPRYANRLLWRWGQIGLDDLEVEVVTLPDRRPVRPRTADARRRST